jgi:serine/threonine-protein kinase
MELVNGPSLAKLLGRNVRVNQAVLMRALEQAAAGLDFAHEKGIFHRHVKPANILIHEDGTPKISDFLLAKSVVPRAGAGSGMKAGNPFYRAPEQLQGQPVNGRADQWALAVIAFEGLTGKRPFDADTPKELFQKIVHEPPPSPALLNPELPAAVEVVLRRALAKDPGARYPSCSEFTRELRATLENRAPAAMTATATAVTVVPEGALAPAADATSTNANTPGTRTSTRLRKLLGRIMTAAS